MFLQTMTEIPKSWDICCCTKGIELTGYNIENGGMPTYPGKWKLLFEIEKVKLKTKKLLKITILDEQESSVQSVDR